MAELIERGKLLKALATSREYHAASCRERNLLIRAEIIVREQPTTTEADIRAKAISEVTEAIKTKLVVRYGNATPTEQYVAMQVTDWCNDLVEQLREE